MFASEPVDQASPESTAKGSPESTAKAVLASPGFSDREGPTKRTAGLNPRSWSQRSWLIIIISAVIIAVVAAAIVGGVFGARARAYPNYYRINYTLKDTCKFT
jgi:hypothetical protein